MTRKGEELTLDNTFVALKKKLSEATELHYEFEGPCETHRGEYYVKVLCEYFGACINSEGQVDVHMRILMANGLPPIHDNELIEWIHDRMVEMVCDGNSEINHEDMVIVSTIEDGAITYVDDNIEKVEPKVLKKCLGRLQRLIPKPEARFPSNHMVMIDSEVVPVMLDFSIRGAWMDEAKGVISVHVTIEGWTPKDIDLYPEMIDDLVSVTIERELEWMKGVPWTLSVDRESLRNLRRGEKKKKYWKHITTPIKRGELHSDEVVEVLSELLAELRPEFKDTLMSQGALKDDNGLVRIETKGLPCPLCLGHLSDSSISSMYHRLRFETMFDNDDDDDDEINSR
jgi:hypothetical protein